ncbi:GNAT family N-acetyltransferase [Streptomyces sp. NPDC053079]|uniref:GNAT family N-acetyltransferase n=1 Tax=Streptomyces sp. NPDC053079 TaxID=3365697 RepID=UPI0037D42DFE
MTRISAIPPVHALDELGLPRPHAWIGFIAVTKGHRRSGAGRALMSEFARRAQETGAARMGWGCWPSTAMTATAARHSSPAAGSPRRGRTLPAIFTRVTWRRPRGLWPPPGAAPSWLRDRDHLIIAITVPTARMGSVRAR